MKTLMVIALLVFAAAAAAQSPVLVDPRTGKYLGRLSSNPYASDSVSNRYGRYGSPYSLDSVNNPYGQYGSPYSPDSANNPYASNPPAIRARSRR